MSCRRKASAALTSAAPSARARATGRPAAAHPARACGRSPPPRPRPSAGRCRARRAAAGRPSPIVSITTSQRSGTKPSAMPSTRPCWIARRRTRRRMYPRSSLEGTTPSASRNVAPRPWSARIRRARVVAESSPERASRALLAEPDQRREVVGLVDRRHVLQDRRHPVQAQAGVDVLLRQVGQRAVRVQLVLHEHQVPELEEALGVVARAGRPRRRSPARGRGRAPNRARTGPVGPDFQKLSSMPSRTIRVVGHADRAPALDRLLVGAQAHLLVAAEDRDPDPLRVEAEALGGQLPRELGRLLLEVVADREVAEHLEEREVPGGHAHVLDVGGAEHLLAGGQPPRRRLLLAAEVRLEGLHAGRGEQHGGVDSSRARATPRARAGVRAPRRSDRNRSRISAAFIGLESRCRPPVPAEGRYGSGALPAKNRRSRQQRCARTADSAPKPAAVCLAPAARGLQAPNMTHRMLLAEQLVGEARERIAAEHGPCASASWSARPRSCSWPLRLRWPCTSPPSGPSTPLLVGGLLVGYALVSRVSFEVGPTSTSCPSSCCSFPMLLLVPLPYVPPLVATAAALSRLPDVISGSLAPRPLDRLPSATRGSPSGPCSCLPPWLPALPTGATSRSTRWRSSRRSPCDLGGR